MSNIHPKSNETIPPVETEENEPAAELVAEPVEAAPSARPPHDLAEFWDELDRELATIDPRPEATEIPLFSTEFSTTFNVKLTSIGPYRISAFVSVPHGEGPFPALFMAPGYASVVTPPAYQDRQRYVVMSLRYRGTRGSDWPYAGTFPGMLTDGIDDPRTWIMRGVIADALRGFEYLVSRPEVDPERVAINGPDSGLFVSARRSGVAVQALSASFYYRMAEAYVATEAYPLEEINDYVRTYPDRRDAVHRTLSYFDPVFQASRVSARFLLSHDNAVWYEPLTKALGGPVEEYAATHEGQRDRDYVEGWIADQLGVARLPRIWSPEDIGTWSS